MINVTADEEVCDLFLAFTRFSIYQKAVFRHRDYYYRVRCLVEWNNQAKPGVFVTM